jgi:hypothetical protein
MGPHTRSQTPTNGRAGSRRAAVAAAVALVVAAGAAGVGSWPVTTATASARVATAPAPAPTTATSTSSGERPALELIGLSGDQLEMVSHAVALFAESGLVLPPLVVHGHSDTAGCGDHDGLHRQHTGWSEIDLCVADPHSPAVMHTVLHELAHAWAADALTDERRAAFRELRGFEFWQNYAAAAWEHNGTEQAAEIIAWGVNDRPAATVRIDHVSCGELQAGYIALTGLEPRYGLTAICAGAVVERS